MSDLFARSHHRNQSAERRQRSGFSRGLLLAMLVFGTIGFPWAWIPCGGSCRCGNWGRPARPYFIPSEAVALYLIVPLSSLCLSVFFLLPGLTLPAAFGREKSLALWILAGFGASLGILTVAHTAVELATGWTLDGPQLFRAGRPDQSSDLRSPLPCTLRAVAKYRSIFVDSRPISGWRLVYSGTVLLLMAPKFYWENFSGDGSGALQVARNLIHTQWPFWPYEAGAIRQAPGLTSVLFVFPESWFVRFWGEWEYSARALHPMALAMLYPILTALIRFGRPDAFLRLGWSSSAGCGALSLLDDKHLFGRLSRLVRG